MLYSLYLRNFSSTHLRKIEINKRIMNPERIKSQTFADKRANKSKHIEDNEDYCSFRKFFFYKLKVHFSERLKLSLMFWLSWKFCLISKYFSKMFVTIILTGFHMFCLHLFVQDVVLQVFLLKCEITVSSQCQQTTCQPSPGRPGRQAQTSTNTKHY